MAGITPEDVDALFTYDAFSILAWIALERWGFCKPGEAPAFTQGGRIEVGGELPMNTNGGLLSEAHIMGWNHQVEIVRQLRGECGPRQVKDVEHHPVGERLWRFADLSQLARLAAICRNWRKNQG